MNKENVEDNWHLSRYRLMSESWPQNLLNNEHNVTDD